LTSRKPEFSKILTIEHSFYYNLPHDPTSIPNHPHPTRPQHLQQILPIPRRARPPGPLRPLRARPPAHPRRRPQRPPVALSGVVDVAAAGGAQGTDQAARDGGWGFLLDLKAQPEQNHLIFVQQFYIVLK
jgi:hypothetical protein